MKVQSQGWKDTLEESTATSPNILDWRIPWTEEPGGYSPQGRKESDIDEVIYRVSIYIYLYIYLSKINPVSAASFAIIFSHSNGCLFICFAFILSSYFFFCLFLFLFHYSRRWVKEDLAVIYVRVFCKCFPLRGL